MRDEIVVVGSDKKLGGWLESILTKCPLHLRFQQIPSRTASPKTVPDLSRTFFQSSTKAVVLMDDLGELTDWTRSVQQEQKGPVLWGVSQLTESLLGIVEKADVKGILTPDTHSVTAACLIKMAIASWQKEEKYRKIADKALTDLENRKRVERAKGILMDRFGLSESDAYQRMRQEAMRNRKSMVQIAESILLMEDLNNMSS
ncbi:ANTAR domain-containing response regulator [Effusibacillus consociatus]|uniref:ANTAR domain-containing response regulator n=1 Tax=Effusibacillus consociatus TaxID=1117041 RepID=A0ABV9Q4A2_9BACL